MEEHIYLENYINEEEFTNLELSLRRYNNVSYEEYIHKYHEILDGNFQGKKKDNKYELSLYTEPVLKKIVGDIKVIYSVNEEEKTVTFETIKPYEILINEYQQELLKYNKKGKEFTFYNDKEKFCKIINTYSKNGRNIFIYTDYTYKKNNKLNVYYGKYDQKENKYIKFKKLDRKEDRFLKEERKNLKNEIEKEKLFLDETISLYNSKNYDEFTPKQIEILKNNNINI